MGDTQGLRRSLGTPCGTRIKEVLYRRKPYTKPVNTQLKTNDEQSKLGIAVVFTTNNIDPDADDIRNFPGFHSQVYTLHVRGVTSTLTIKQLEEPNEEDHSPRPDLRT